MGIKRYDILTFVGVQLTVYEKLTILSGLKF